MREVRVLRAAAEEAAEAASFYEGAQPGLGGKFEQAFFDAIALLREELVPLSAISPELSRLGVGRIILRRFPFSIVARKAEDAFEVVAVAHHSRRPAYWRARLST